MNIHQKYRNLKLNQYTKLAEIVLSKVVIPEYIVVHDGPVGDNSASNYYVRYRDYIKNVASSEIYATCLTTLSAPTSWQLCPLP